jgi:D-alanyl-D-alanine carboxypeptidase
MFENIVNTSEKEIFSQDGDISHDLENSNRLVTGEIPLDGVIGGKTGFTFDAGHTLVCAARRNDHTLVSVVLKTSVNTKTASAYESQKLLNWGFDSFSF